MLHWAINPSIQPFESEEATHFHYTRAVASGGVIPADDSDSFYPDHFPTFENTPVFKEYLVGWSARAVGVATGVNAGKGAGVDPNLHGFIRNFTALFSSLSVLPLYFLVAVMTGSRVLGLISGILYALCPGAAERGALFYINENFSLPFLFTHFTFLALALNKRSPRLSLWSVPFFLAGTAGWMFGRYYAAMTAFFCWAGVCVLPARGQNAEQMNFAGIKYDRIGLALVCLIQAAGVTLSALFIPYLAARDFVLTPAPAVLWGLAVFLCLRAWKPAMSGGMATALGLTVLLVSLVFAVFFGPGGRDYDHLNDLPWYKLKNMFTLPIDSSVLPYHVRSFWCSGMESPSMTRVIDDFNLLAPVCFIVLFHLASSRLGFGRKGAGPMPRLDSAALILVVSGCMITVGLYLMFVRAKTLLGFFLVALVMAVSGGNSSTSGVGGAVSFRPFLKWTVLIIILSADLFTLALIPGAYRASPPDLVLETLRQVARIAPETGAVSSDIPFSPMILAYTGRKVNFNSQFESRAVREKARQYQECLFSRDEADLVNYCIRNETSCLVIPHSMFLEEGPGSDRYVAGGPASSEEENLFRLLYLPEATAHFSSLGGNGLNEILLFNPEVKDAANAGEIDLHHAWKLVRWIMKQEYPGKYLPMLEGMARRYLAPGSRKYDEIMFICRKIAG